MPLLPFLLQTLLHIAIKVQIKITTFGFQNVFVREKFCCFDEIVLLKIIASRIEVPSGDTDNLAIRMNGFDAVSSGISIEESTVLSSTIFETLERFVGIDVLCRPAEG